MTEQSQEKRFWTRRKKVLATLLGLVAIGAGVYLYRDKPAKLVQTTDYEQEVDHKKGEIVDYRYAFNAAQDAQYSPAEENGWRLILQALGPRALEQNFIASTIPWEKFPTTEGVKTWFDGYWTKLCEKFNLDPHERPTMLDRISLYDYVCKHGLTGTEPEPAEDDIQRGFYYENYEKRPGKVDATTVETALLAGPWTAEQYPNAAKWLDENGDYYDMLARAARSPKFGCWHFVPESGDGGFIGMLLPDTQTTRHFARMLAIRANYRVASGNISGAIDDVETIALIARSLLENDERRLIERLVGLAIAGIAAGVPLYANPDVAPTQEELARAAQIWRSFYPDDDLRAYIAKMFRGEKNLTLGAYTDLLALRRKGGLGRREFVQFFSDVAGFSDAPRVTNHFVTWATLALPPIDDARSFQIYKELAESLGSEPVSEFQSRVDQGAAANARLTSSPEKNLAYAVFRLLEPAINGALEAFYRSDCTFNEAALATALLAYQAEHGTLPPAFTVDNNGAPLHSWRVLILPYLGDDAKALYDQLRLDEPWDSEHNRAFHDKAPSVFQCPTAKLAPGETLYSVLLGDEGLFDESGVGKEPRDMLALPGRDVMRQTLVVERPEPVCWMTPDAELKLADLTADGEADVAKFMKDARHNGGLNVVSINGGVSFTPTAVSNVELDSLLRGLPAPVDEEPGEPEPGESAPQP